MKLSVSNIAWENSELEAHLQLLADLGCDGVDLATSCLWPEPVEATAEERKRIVKLIAGKGLEIAGYHALLYTRPDLTLFADRTGFEKTVDYLKKLVGICGDMGGRALVFGSPRNRTLHGRPYEECLAWAVEGFRRVAEEAKRGIL